jgi:hypothetical protein
MEDVYWPSAGVNTIGAWNAHQGYKIKLEQEVTFDFPGYNMVSHTLALDAGWNLIPVICDGDAVCTDLFDGLGNDLTVVKEVAGTQVYWPGEDVMTLNQLSTGKSYMVKMEAPGSITFPENATRSNTPNLNSRSRDCTMTGNSHLISIPAETLATCNVTIQSGDIIQAMDVYGNICGSIEIDDPIMDYALVVFGNDTLTSQQEGYDNGEIINLLLMPHEYPIMASWDDNYPNGASYADEGISKLTYMLALTSVEEEVSKMIRISPNPATDKISISGIDKYPVNVEILNCKGQVVLTFDKLSANEINVSGLKQGLYFIHIQNDDLDLTRKLIVR